MAGKTLPMALVSVGSNVGAAVLVLHKDGETMPQGFYAIFGDESWTEDYDTVVAMLAGESPDARAYPVDTLDGADVPAIPKDWPPIA